MTNYAHYDLCLFHIKAKGPSTTTKKKLNTAHSSDCSTFLSGCLQVQFNSVLFISRQITTIVISRHLNNKVQFKPIGMSDKWQQNTITYQSEAPAEHVQRALFHFLVLCKGKKKYPSFKSWARPIYLKTGFWVIYSDLKALKMAVSWERYL